jgi:glycosyltransferase involved in cell wall biosynthesis
VALLDSGKVEFEADGTPRGGHALGWKDRLPPRLRVLGRDALYLLHNRRFRARLEEFAAREGPFDAVYERYHAFEWAPGAWARASRLPWVLEFNASVDELKLLGGLGLGRVGRAVEDRVVRGANQIVAVSGVLRDHLLRRGVDGARVHVLHNAVDEERFQPGIDGAPVRARHGLGDRAVIGFVGSFAAYHGVDLFFESAAEVARREPGAVFFLVGGRRGNRRYEDLRAAVERDFPAGAVVFAGEVPHDQIPAHLAAMDVAVIPMAADYGSPTKTFEYLAMGRAVIAPGVPALREVLRDGENALLTKPASRDSLTEAMLRLCRDPGLRAGLGRAARETILASHTWSGNARAIDGLLQTALAEGPR